MSSSQLLATPIVNQTLPLTSHVYQLGDWYNYTNLNSVYAWRKLNTACDYDVCIGGVCEFIISMSSSYPSVCKIFLKIITRIACRFGHDF